MSVFKPDPLKLPWRWIDRSDWSFLIFIAFGWTLLATIPYTFLTMRNAGNGIKVDGYCKKIPGEPESPCTPQAITWPVAFGDAVYFSIATETTVGYGDLTPQGWSRVVACIQAIVGLMIAGLFLARITTGPSGKTKALIHRMEGYWIEFSLADECDIVSLIIIKYTDGELRYDGINYTETGNARRDFNGTSQPISTIDGPRVRFDYTNLKGDDKVFKEGKTHLLFSKKPLRNWWIHDPNDDGAKVQLPLYRRFLKVENYAFSFAEGKAIDVGHSIPIPMFAVRAESDGWAFKSWNGILAEEMRQRIARESYEKYKGQIISFRAHVDVKTGEA